MRRISFSSRLSVMAVTAALLLTPLASLAQTRITMPKNKYSVQDDVKLGNDAARQVEKQFPLINDSDADAYLERVGQRLVNSIPSQFNQPAFNYRFQWVNASDLNAFALPGGPMYVNRGMLEAAHNEGELAGVMAHEISHVALRHATAQQTKNTSGSATLRNLGLILGGAILGGSTGAQLGALFAQGWALKYSREYESQADTLGAQILADAGYDPRDLANVFQTISSQSRGSGPEWLSSHPDPGNRYQKINQEARYLRVSPNPIKITRDFERVQARFRAMPKARTMAEIEKSGGTYDNGNSGSTMRGNYSRNVPNPSNQVKTYNAGSVSFNIPSNWQEFTGDQSATFAPQGAYGDQGITHGLLAGLYPSQTRSLARDTDAYVNDVLSGNSYLRKNGGRAQTYVGGRQGYSIQLSGRSPVTGRTEIATVYTTQMRDGSLLYLVTVVPSNETGNYSYAFRNILNSVRMND